ncbi:MAG TPA: hypothetical protein VH575_15035, partial [Gemmataceae bacterium]
GDVDANYRQDAGLKNGLHRLADLLSDAFHNKKEPRVKYDSPRDFKPDLLRQTLNHLREQLQRRGVE